MEREIDERQGAGWLCRIRLQGEALKTSHSPKHTHSHSHMLTHTHFSSRIHRKESTVSELHSQTPESLSCAAAPTSSVCLSHSPALCFCASDLEVSISSAWQHCLSATIPCFHPELLIDSEHRKGSRWSRTTTVKCFLSPRMILLHLHKKNQKKKIHHISPTIKNALSHEVSLLPNKDFCYLKLVTPFTTWRYLPWKALVVAACRAKQKCF